MYGDLEGVQTGTKHGANPWVLMGEAEDSSKGREFSGMFVWYKTGRHAR